MELGNGGLIDQLKKKAEESEESDLRLDAQEVLGTTEEATTEEATTEEATTEEATTEHEDFQLQQEPSTTSEEYVPNKTFKVHDESLEFDEFVVPLLTSKEAEAKVRDLYERAHGLDIVKKDRQTLRDENQNLMSVRENYAAVEKDLKQLGSYLKQGDIQSFLEAHNINDDTIYQYAMQKLRMQEDPELQQQYDQGRQNVQQQYDQQSELEYLRGQQQQHTYAAKEQELNFSLTDPMVQQAEREYNTRLGEGAFRNEVINRGKMHYTNTQQDISANDAVRQVMSVMGYTQGQAANTTQQTYNAAPQYAAPQQAPMQGQQRGKPEVIPNIRGRSTTPVKRIPKSIQELRDLSNQMNG